VTKDSVVVSSYTYDDNGNRLTHTTPQGTTTATYNGQDQLLTYGDYAYTYNARGQLATKTNTTTNETTTYTYDARGDLRSVTLPDNTLIEYVVDARSQRLLKKVNGQIEQGWLYRDRLRPASEFDGTGAVVARFIYTGRANVPEYMIKAGLAYRLIHDHLGGVRLVVNSDTGVVDQRITYDESGFIGIGQDTNPGFQPFGFAGGIHDPDTRLTRFGARDYDPRVGRWTARDPTLFYGGDSVLYRYAFGDPINYTDPRGLFFQWWGWGYVYTGAGATAGAAGAAAGAWIWAGYNAYELWKEMQEPEVESWEDVNDHREYEKDPSLCINPYREDYSKCTTEEDLTTCLTCCRNYYRGPKHNECTASCNNVHNPFN
jgi:RHS repeat-associated protein